MFTYALRISYIGTHFYGWQTQKNTTLPTIQSTLEQALTHIFSTHIPVVGASRTDTGVHALYQVAHIRTPKYIKPYSLLARMHTLLPETLRILHVALVENSFHAQKTIFKIYSYKLWESRVSPPPQMAPYVWGVPPLDIHTMQGATSVLLGKQDFATLQNATPAEFTDTTKTIDAITLHRETTAYNSSSPLITLTIQGSGFLRHMIRNIVGALVAIGKKNYSKEELFRALLTKKRTSLATPTAPAKALCLEYIAYPEYTILEETLR